MSKKQELERTEVKIGNIQQKLHAFNYSTNIIDCAFEKLIVALEEEIKVIEYKKSIKEKRKRKK